MQVIEYSGEAASARVLRSASEHFAGGSSVQALWRRTAMHAAVITHLQPLWPQPLREERSLRTNQALTQWCVGRAGSARF